METQQIRQKLQVFFDILTSGQILKTVNTERYKAVLIAMKSMDNELSENQIEKFITSSAITIQMKTRGSLRDDLTSENEGLFREIRKTYNERKYPQIFFFTPQK